MHADRSQKNDLLIPTERWLDDLRPGLMSGSASCPACRGRHRAHICGKQKPQGERISAAAMLAVRRATEARGESFESFGALVGAQTSATVACRGSELAHERRVVAPSAMMVSGAATDAVCEAPAPTGASVSLAGSQANRSVVSLGGASSGVTACTELGDERQAVPSSPMTVSGAAADAVCGVAPPTGASISLTGHQANQSVVLLGGTSSGVTARAPLSATQLATLPVVVTLAQYNESTTVRVAYYRCRGCNRAVRNDQTHCPMCMCEAMLRRFTAGVAEGRLLARALLTHGRVRSARSARGVGAVGRAGHLR